MSIARPRSPGIRGSAPSAAARANVETISSASSDQLRGSPLTAVFSSESSLTVLFELAAIKEKDDDDDDEGRGRRAEDRTSSNEHGEKSPFPRKKDNEEDE